jgi:hypothetical protein
VSTWLGGEFRVSTWLGGEFRVSTWLGGELRVSRLACRRAYRYSSWLGGESKTVAGLVESSESVLEGSKRQLLAWGRVQSQYLAWGRALIQ